MLISEGRLSFKVNDSNLGVAFKDKRLLESRLRACVYMMDAKDEVWILAGMQLTQNRDPLMLEDADNDVEFKYLSRNERLIQENIMLRGQI